MSTVADYIGRTVDVLAFHGAKASGQTALTQDLVEPGGSGQICTGTQKLAQRWLLEFLTVQGSLEYLPLRGSTFITDVRAGTMRTAVDVEQSFYLAADQVQTNLLEEEDDTMNDDERIDSSDLNSFTLAVDQLTLTVVLTSQAGNSRQVILPIKTRTV